MIKSTESLRRSCARRASHRSAVSGFLASGRSCNLFSTMLRAEPPLEQGRYFHHFQREIDKSVQQQSRSCFESRKKIASKVDQVAVTLSKG